MKFDEFRQYQRETVGKAALVLWLAGVACLIALFLVGACVSTGTQVRGSALASYQPGLTTRAQVEHDLGPPQSATTLPDGRVMTSYFGLHAQSNAASFVPVVGIFAGKTHVQSSMVQFRFDAAGKLIDFTQTQNQTGTRVVDSPQDMSDVSDPAVKK